MPHFFCFLSWIFCNCLYADKIEIKKENGVTVVYNPKKPAPPPGVPTKLTLNEDLTIGVKEGEEEYMLLSPRSLAVDEEENIYVLDRKAGHVKVYGKNGKFLRRIGKKGQGTGEPQGPRDIHVTPQNELLVNDTSTRRLVVQRQVKSLLIIEFKIRSYAFCGLNSCLILFQINFFIF